MALSRPLAALAATSFALVALNATAHAGGDLESGDSRASVHDKNVTTCEAAGLPGKTIASADVKASVDGSNTYIDVLDHTGITAVVVKGGDAYNVYLADALSGGWTGLHSPLNPNGKPAQISHWFACGGTTEQPPPTKEQPPTTTTATSTTSSAAATPATSVTTSTAAAAGSRELASTGFGSAWLLGLGSALLAAGAAVLLVLRRRRA
ncbi:LPXTG cell wall anchor domain-containing protein [Lentzea sp. NPDC004782]|uniref:LPXTG cell wall anchor domain-containing protein n=1 Tax=Lentzea sp. NPDC004782 TaxID=3154458 RepID=UPI0033A54E56